MIADETHAIQEEPEPPFVIDVVGEVAPDGKAIGLRIQRSAQGPIDLCLRIQDVQYMVSMMLALGCEAKRLQGLPEPESPPNGAIPLLSDAGGRSCRVDVRYAGGGAGRSWPDPACPERAQIRQAIVTNPPDL